MKKIIILAIGILLSTGSIMAQNRGDRNGGRQFSAKDRIETLKKELKLTDEQTEQVTVLFTDFEKKMSGTEKKDREQMRTDRENLNKSIESILTDDQKAAYKKMQENRPDRQRGGKGGNRH